MFKEIKCAHCGTVVERYPSAKLCWDCLWDKRSPLAGKASAKVAAAIRRGDLMPAKEQKCVDCGKPACDYDHRDYTKPLDVDPVCRGCNCARGPAYPYNVSYKPY